MKKTYPLLLCLLALVSCTTDKKTESNQITAETRIVSLNGTTTEILCGLGLEKNIVGVDVTSTYPEAVNSIQKVGYGKNIAAEKVLALQPTLVVGLQESIKPELAEQLRSAGTRVLLYSQEFSPEGTRQLIHGIADSLQLQEKKEQMLQQIDKDLAAKKQITTTPKVLFIYARGAGTLTVCGNKTAAQKIIELSGGKNAITGFDEYKPLTSEALVTANPDVVLMFTSGLQSLGGMDGFLKIPGMDQTNAGKNKRVIEMDGQYLTGFGPRIGQVITDLSKELSEAQH